MSQSAVTRFHIHRIYARALTSVRVHSWHHLPDFNTLSWRRQQHRHHRLPLLRCRACENGGYSCTWSCALMHLLAMLLLLMSLVVDSREPLSLQASTACTHTCHALCAAGLKRISTRLLRDEVKIHVHALQVMYIHVCWAITWSH